MDILKVTNIEDSFDGSYIKEFHFDEIIRIPFIRHLGKIGEVKFITPSPGAIFTVTSHGKFILKGTENNRTVRVIIENKNADETLQMLLKHIKEFTFVLGED